MPRNEQPLKELKDQLKRFSEFDKEKLIKRPAWGTINLEEARADIDKIYDIINYLKVLPLEKLTVEAINTIKGAITPINDHFDKINNFSIETANPGAQKNAFISTIQSHADSLYTQASPWIPFLAYQKGDVAQNIQALTESVQRAQKLIDEAKNNITDRNKEIEEIIVKAREASAAAGAAVFTKDFQKESDSLKENAKKWLWATAIMGIVTLCLAGTMWHFTESGLDSGQLWQKLGTKLAILAILISGTFWCGKIYKALMHQSSINRHRSMGIQTLQAFSAAVEDTSIKDAVVLEAAKAVFGNVPTGYIDNDSNSDSDVKVFEIAKNILPKSGG